MTLAFMKSVISGVIFGVAIYLVSDVYGDFTTFIKLRKQGMKFAEENDELKTEIGFPFVNNGPWYNSTIGWAPSHHVASITFPLKGSKNTSNISVKAIRSKSGLDNTAAYNMFGAGEWLVLDCQASVKGENGTLSSRSLLPNKMNVISANI